LAVRSGSKHQRRTRPSMTRCLFATERAPQTPTILGLEGGRRRSGSVAARSSSIKFSQPAAVGLCHWRRGTNGLQTDALGRITRSIAFVETVFQRQNPTAVDHELDPVGNFHPSLRWAQRVYLRKPRATSRRSRYYCTLLSRPMQNGAFGRARSDRADETRVSQRPAAWCWAVILCSGGWRNDPIGRGCDQKMGATKEDCLIGVSRSAPNYVRGNFVTIKLQRSA